MINIDLTGLYSIKNLSLTFKMQLGSCACNFIAGGYNGTDYNNSVNMIDSSFTIKSLTNLTDKRRRLVGEYLLLDRLFAGGYDGTNALNNIYVYDKNLVKHTSDVCLRVGKYYSSAGIINNNIFIAGGTYKNNILSDIDIFNYIM